VIFTRIRLPTFGYPQIPHKRNHTGGIVVVVDDDVRFPVKRTLKKKMKKIQAFGKTQTEALSGSSSNGNGERKSQKRDRKLPEFFRK